MKIQLGDRVTDTITGFTGIVLGRSEYLYGCVQTLVQTLVKPEKLNKDGKPIDGEWFDEDRLAVVKSEVFQAPASASTRLGGPSIDTPPPGR